MFSARLLRLVLLLSLAIGMPLHAQGADGYSVTVPVKDTSSAERSDAFATGLTQVLARVTGGQDLRDKPGYADALKNAGGIVKQYQYHRDDVATPGMSLQMSFDPAAVQRIISGMDVAGTGVKPPILVVVTGADGQPLDADELGALKAAVQAHGYDIKTASASSLPDIDSLKQADTGALAKVSQQYKTGLVLIGSLTDSGADWTLISGGQAQTWKASGTSSDSLLTDAGNILSGRLGKQLNVIGIGTTSGKLWVSNVRSAIDYANVLATMRNDSSVQKVTTVGAQDDGVWLAVQASVPLNALAAGLGATGHLVQADSHDGADAALRWVH